MQIDFLFNVWSLAMKPVFQISYRGCGMPYGSSTMLWKSGTGPVHFVFVLQIQFLELSN